MTLTKDFLSPGNRFLWGAIDYTLIKREFEGAGQIPMWYLIDTNDQNAKFVLKPEDEILKFGMKLDPIILEIRKWIPKTTLIKRRSDANNIDIYTIELQFDKRTVNKAIQTSLAIPDHEKKHMEMLKDKVEDLMRNWLKTVMLQLNQFFYTDKHFKTLEQLDKFYFTRYEEWEKYRHKQIIEDDRIG